MFSNIQKYQDRKISHQKNLLINNWKIKLYTISTHDTFQSKEILKNIITTIPSFLEHPNQSELDVYNLAFLIVHEGKDGVWILFNWWTGGEMVQTQLYFTDYNKPVHIVESPYKKGGSLMCTWELEIFTHERKTWIEHILMKIENPDIPSYLNDVLNT